MAVKKNEPGVTIFLAAIVVAVLYFVLFYPYYPVESADTGDNFVSLAQAMCREIFSPYCPF